MLCATILHVTLTYVSTLTYTHAARLLQTLESLIILLKMDPLAYHIHHARRSTRGKNSKLGPDCAAEVGEVLLTLALPLNSP